MENFTDTEEQENAPSEEGSIKIDVSLAPQISFACHQNSVPLIRDISISNDTGKLLKDITLQMNVSPSFVVSKTWSISSLTSGAEVKIPDRDTTLNGEFLLELTESMRGEVTFSLLQEEVEIAKTVSKVEVLARNEWGGFGTQPELLAAFSMPNDPAIDKILSQATDILRRSKKDDALDGYDSGERTRSWEVVSAIWSSLGGLGLAYSLPPKSFEKTGQKIRTPSMILSGGLATCIDTTMLFCSAIEQASLHPIVIMKDGHSFVGVWLQPDRFRSVVMDDVTDLRKRIQQKEILVFETTLITQKSRLPFETAINKGRKQLAEEVEDDFVCAIDIQRARQQQIKPLSFVGDTIKPDDGSDSSPPVRDKPPTMSDAPPLGGFSKPEPLIDEETSKGTRLERWQRKLLDLSLRNPLLNYRSTQTAIPIICPDPGLLEDKLAEGKSISLLPLPSMTTDEGRDDDIHGVRTGKNLNEEFVSSALMRNEIYVSEDKNKLETRMVSLYRKAKADLEEGGANTLFLALGFLVWKREDKKDKKFRAPLILIPVELKRKSVRSGVKLVLHDDEPRFNTTLLEMLRQDIGLDIQGLDGELLADESGVDVTAIWAKIRQKIKNVEGFEVTEEVVLGTFSFAKYLMWKDLVDRTDKLKENPVVRHLMDTPRESYTTDLAFPEPCELDKRYAPKEIFTPLPADSSQLSTVIASGQGKDFVIIGPPGSGKSQSISNMIAHLMGAGKTVLFVSEKAAALNVVYRRLKDVGLGDFCLELHSNKAKRVDVLNQFRNAWDVAEDMTQDEWVKEAGHLKKRRDELNKYVECLHAVYRNGLTIHKAIGFVVKNKDIPKINLSYKNVDQHTEDDLTKLREHVHDLKISAEKLENVTEHPLNVIAQANWSNAWQREIIHIAEALALSAKQLQEAIAAISNKLNFDEDDLSLEQVEALSMLAEAITDAYRLKPDFALDSSGGENITDAETASGLLAEYRKITENLSVSYQALPWQLISVEDLTKQWLDAENSWWPKSALGRSKVRKTLVKQAGAKGKLAPNNDLKVLAELQKLGIQIDEFTKKLSPVPDWHGFDTDITVLGQVLGVAKRLRQGILSTTEDTDRLLSLKVQVKKLVGEGNEFLGEDVAIGRSFKRAVECQKNYHEAFTNFSLKAGQPLGDVLSPQKNGLNNIVSSCENIVKHKNRLNEWCAWRDVRNSAIDQGLKPLVDALESGDLAIDRLEDGFDASYCRWWVEIKMDADNVLRSFNSNLHEDKIEQFRVLDKQVLSMTSKYVRARICSDIPEKDGINGNSEYGTLRRILGQTRPRKSLRSLITDMPNALTQLTPCVLMSPLSISQYLPVEQKAFDVVIFDEASQITVWDAIGSIARAKQTIVAGDPKQLPPTNFFGRSEDDSEESADDVDLPSILDEMLGAGIPTRHLKWHYRSENESLITFSNHKYYEGNLITFPSPRTEDQAVKLVPVDGIYLRGKGRTNRAEADAIVAEIVRRLKDPVFNKEKRTIGVVTFNTEQKRLIEDLLDEERKRHPDIEPHFGEDLIEPVFVKNIESVQGDERDIILFSITFGKDMSGRMTMDFGAINKDGGERRLNVAITRARSEMIVFSSIDSDEIDLTRTQSTGVEDLKHFLNYAKRGVKSLGEAVSGSVGDFESPFEIAVARGLQERGWIVHPQIGVSAFRIDIGIVHPEFPGRYLVGVECDGATYHRSATARDRDQVRQEILSRLGWKLIRLWSTDFWVDGEGELDRLDREIRNVLEIDSKERAVKKSTEKATDDKAIITPVFQEDTSSDEPESKEPIDTVTEEPLRQETLVAHRVTAQNEKYKIFTFEEGEYHLNPDIFYDIRYTDTLKKLIRDIVNLEAPIREDVIARRVARAHDFKKTGRKIFDVVSHIVRGEYKLILDEGHNFIWPVDVDPAGWNIARFPANEESKRTVEEISTEELKAFAIFFKSSANSVEEIKRALGFARLKTPAKNRIEKAVQSVREGL